MQLSRTVPDIADGLAAALGFSIDQVRIALDGASGIGHDDYFAEFSRILNVDVSRVRRAFVRVWLRTGDNLAAAKRYVEELKAELLKLAE